MENTVNTQAVNPLKKFFRQPKFYIKLPSSGNFYPPGALEMTDNGEFSIYAMTAKDEIAMKTPDALLNGQSIVDMIQSCVPNIKNAWTVPSIDIDALLVAIRMATYGETLDIDITIPNTKIEKTYVADLRRVLDRLLNAAFDPIVAITPEMTAHIRPLNYLEFTRSAIKTLEEQRIFDIVNNENIDDERKVEMFSKSFKRLTDITVGTVSQCVVKIVTPDGEVSDQQFITEFIENADKNFYAAIMSNLEKQRDQFKMEPFKVHTSEEERAAGAPHEFEFPIELDAANFFA
jgi:hypothetical protein